MDADPSRMAEGVMETPLKKRLKIRMDFKGMNARQLAMKAGLGESYVRDILRGKSQKPAAENLEKLAAALETTIDWFIAGNESSSKTSNSVEPAGEEFALTNMIVRGEIQAGAWLDRTVIDEDYSEYETIPVARDPRFPRAKQYSLKVKGDSMDLEYPDGTYVTCVDYFESGISFKTGITVHVERRTGHLVENTLKVVELVEGVMMLVPKSSNPNHKPIPLEGDGGTEIVICGVVTGSYRRAKI